MEEGPTTFTGLDTQAPTADTFSTALDPRPHPFYGSAPPRSSATDPHDAPATPVHHPTSPSADHTPLFNGFATFAPHLSGTGRPSEPNATDPAFGGFGESTLQGLGAFAKKSDDFDEGTAVDGGFTFRGFSAFAKSDGVDEDDAMDGGFGFDAAKSNDSDEDTAMEGGFTFQGFGAFAKSTDSDDDAAMDGSAEAGACANAPMRTEDAPGTGRPVDGDEADDVQMTGGSSESSDEETFDFESDLESDDSETSERRPPSGSGMGKGGIGAAGRGASVGEVPGKRAPAWKNQAGRSKAPHAAVSTMIPGPSGPCSFDVERSDYDGGSCEGNFDCNGCPA